MFILKEKNNKILQQNIYFTYLLTSEREKAVKNKKCRKAKNKDAAEITTQFACNLRCCAYLCCCCYNLYAFARMCVSSTRRKWSRDIFSKVKQHIPPKQPLVCHHFALHLYACMCVCILSLLLSAPLQCILSVSECCLTIFAFKCQPSKSFAYELTWKIAPHSGDLLCLAVHWRASAWPCTEIQPSNWERTQASFDQKMLLLIAFVRRVL